MGNTSITTYDIAREAGVSRTTVSYVLNGRMDIAIPEQTRLRVLDIAKKMGYQANRVARALASGKTQTIAFWTYGLYETYYTHALHHFRDNLKNDGFDMHIVETNDLIDESASWRHTDTWPVDGILVFESPQVVDAYLEANSGPHKPLVSAGVYCSDRSDYVSIDLFTASMEAVQHLLSSGRKRVAWLGSAGHCHPGHNRYDAYTSVMSKAGLAPEYIAINSSFAKGDRPAAFEMLPDYIASHGCPEAMFCYSDDMAIGAQRALQDLGYRIPDDVAIFGCDGIADTAYHQPRISTIELPVGEVCRLAWKFLKKRMEDPTANRQQVILQPKLVIRESSGG